MVGALICTTIKVIFDCLNLSFSNTFLKMQITRVFVVLATIIVVGYAAIEPLDLEAEESKISTQHSRQKRGLIAAKLGLLGGALLAKKALLLGTGAGIIGGGLAGGAIYKLKSKLHQNIGDGYNGGYGGGYNNVGYGGGYNNVGDGGGYNNVGYGGGYNNVGYGGGYNNVGYGGGYNPGYYSPPSGGYNPYPNGGGVNLGEGVYPVYLPAYPKKSYDIYGGISGGYNYDNEYANKYNYPPC